MERETGSGRGTGSPDRAGGTEELLRAVREAAAADYDILGEMGRGERGSVVYLAREKSSQRLVALKLRPDDGEYELSVMRELDASIPGASYQCPSCNAELAGWGRFCSHCGGDLSGVHASKGSRKDMLAAVHEAAKGRYEVLGEMEQPEGDGVIYFARELTGGRLVALRLSRASESDGRESYALAVTQVIKPLAASLGATYTAPAPTTETPTPATVSAAPSMRSPQPSARSPTPPSVMVPGPMIDQPLQAPRKRSPMLPVAGFAALLLVGGALMMRAAAKHPGVEAEQDTSQVAVVIPATAPAAQPALPPVAAPESGYVDVGALPKGALFMVDGRATNDRFVALTAGSHRLVVTARGYRTASQRVSIAGGQTLSWAPAMERASSAKKPAAAEALPTIAAAPTCLNAYSDKSWSAAFAACTREAAAGNQSAQRNLGVMYDQGLGTARDEAQAATWFRKAGETGNRDAAFQLAMMYENGRGVAKDENQAIAWYRKAALLGDVDSQVKLGRAYDEGKGVEGNAGEATAWYQRAADQGNLFALNRLGEIYAEGRGAVKDEARAVKLFQSAAAKGDAQGEYNLATMYAKGRGIARSDSAANDLYVKAAKQGNADAIREATRRKLKY